MLGTRQLDHMQRCIVDVLTRNIAGDLIEAGVWRGGMTIFMRAVLRAYQITDRKVLVADSFDGLPEIDRQRETFAWRRGDMAVSLEAVKNNFARYGLLDDQVVFLKGFFSETLPTAPVRQLSILGRTRTFMNLLWTSCATSIPHFQSADMQFSTITRTCRIAAGR